MRYMVLIFVIVAAALAVPLARIALKLLGESRWVLAAILAGLALPVTAVLAGLVFLLAHPSSDQAGAGMMFAGVSAISALALPGCLVAAFLSTRRN